MIRERELSAEEYRIVSGGDGVVDPGELRQVEITTMMGGHWTILGAVDSKSYHVHFDGGSPGDPHNYSTIRASEGGSTLVVLLNSDGGKIDVTGDATVNQFVLTYSDPNGHAASGAPSYSSGLVDSSTADAMPFTLSASDAAHVLGSLSKGDYGMATAWLPDLGVNISDKFQSDTPQVQFDQNTGNWLWYAGEGRSVIYNGGNPYSETSYSVGQAGSICVQVSPDGQPTMYQCRYEHVDPPPQPLEPVAPPNPPEPSLLFEKQNDDGTTSSTDVSAFLADVNYDGFGYVQASYVDQNGNPISAAQYHIDNPFAGDIAASFNQFGDGGWGSALGTGPGDPSALFGEMCSPGPIAIPSVELSPETQFEIALFDSLGLFGAAAPIVLVDNSTPTTYDPTVPIDLSAYAPMPVGANGCP